MSLVFSASLRLGVFKKTRLLVVTRLETLGEPLKFAQVAPSFVAKNNTLSL